MTIGFDFNDTITAYPMELRHLARAIMDSGGEVYIVSAVKYWNHQKTEERIRHAGIPHTSAHVINFKEYAEIPNLKYDMIRKLGIELFFDDNPATVFLLATNGILACKVEGTSRHGGLM